MTGTVLNMAYWQSVVRLTTTAVPAQVTWCLTQSVPHCECAEHKTCTSCQLAPSRALGSEILHPFHAEFVPFVFCLAVCNGSPTIANGVFSCSPGSVFGSSCTATCNDPFSLSPTATCKSEGWVVAGSCSVIGEWGRVAGAVFSLLARLI